MAKNRLICTPLERGFGAIFAAHNGMFWFYSGLFGCMDTVWSPSGPQRGREVATT
jgi:hypothetical protein